MCFCTKMVVCLIQVIESNPLDLDQCYKRIAYITLWCQSVTAFYCLKRHKQNDETSTDILLIFTPDIFLAYPLADPETRFGGQISKGYPNF